MNYFIYSSFNPSLPIHRVLKMIMGLPISYFCCSCDKNLSTKVTAGRKVLFWFTVGGFSLSWWDIIVAGAWGSLCCSQSREAENSECLCAAYSFLYSLESRPREWCHSQWAHLLTSINLIKIILHRLPSSPSLPGHSRSDHTDNSD